MEPDYKTIREIEELLIIQRGKIVSIAIILEKVINTFISDFLCTEDKRKIDIFEFVLEKNMFSKNVEILEGIIRKYYPNIIKNNPTLFSDIKKATETRNSFAHKLPYHLVNIETAIEKYKKDGIIGFVKIKEVVDPIFYDKNESDKFNELCKKCIKTINNIF